jgi:hypothetical protein
MAVEALDRELAFYRRRAGQVFFIGLLVEGLISGGKEKIHSVPTENLWIQALVYSFFFLAVAAISSVLGSEYRQRIHDLKRVRSKIMERLYGESSLGYTQIGGATLSEIQVLYIVLILLSSCGTLLSWWKAFAMAGAPDAWIWAPMSICLVASVLGIVYVTVVVVRWSVRSLPQRLRNMTSGS